MGCVVVSRTSKRKHHGGRPRMQMAGCTFEKKKLKKTTTRAIDFTLSQQMKKKTKLLRILSRKKTKHAYVFVSPVRQGDFRKKFEFRLVRNPTVFFWLCK